VYHINGIKTQPPAIDFIRTEITRRAIFQGVTRYRGARKLFLKIPMISGCPKWTRDRIQHGRSAPVIDVSSVAAPKKKGDFRFVKSPALRKCSKCPYCLAELA